MEYKLKEAKMTKMHVEKHPLAPKMKVFAKLTQQNIYKTVLLVHYRLGLIKTHKNSNFFSKSLDG
jgi:hypothetical protein